VRSRLGSPRAWLLIAPAVLAACGEDEITWVQFNADDQVLEVEVLPVGEPAGEPVSLALLSNLGRTEVGVAAVDPGSGPVGTDHLVTVDVYDAFEEEVLRVTVFILTEAVSDLDGDGEPDSRSEEEHELRQDSADLGAWALEFKSLGADDERRTDQFTFFLWQPEDIATGTGSP
jgi:hypothetical protein